MESGRACVTADTARTSAKEVEEEASSRENHFELRSGDSPSPPHSPSARPETYSVAYVQNRSPLCNVVLHPALIYEDLQTLIDRDRAARLG